MTAYLGEDWVARRVCHRRAPGESPIDVVASVERRLIFPKWVVLIVQRDRKTDLIAQASILTKGGPTLTAINAASTACRIATTWGTMAGCQLTPPAEAQPYPTALDRWSKEPADGPRPPTR